MLSLFIFFVLLGMAFYMFVQSRYYKIKLEDKQVELKKATEKKKMVDENIKCPKYFSVHNNSCRYNTAVKQFTCQFNPKDLTNSGYFYNSPDICCNNRCSELNKILDIILEKQKDEGSEGNVWCQLNSGTKCQSYNSTDGNCPVDKLTNQSLPAFATEADCEKFGKTTVCNNLEKTNCFAASSCVWSEPEGDDAGKCTYGTPDGTYNATLDNSVGYIDGDPTAIAGNTNPYFLVSTLDAEKDDDGDGDGGDGE